VKPARPLLDGNTIKWTLEQIEQKNPERVRVDWLRFTVPVDALVPHVGPDLDWVRGTMATLDGDWTQYRGLVPPRFALEMLSIDGQECYLTPKSLATIGHFCLTEILPGLFPLMSNHPVEDSGMDFYAARSPLYFEGQLVGFVLAGGRSLSQSSTVHFNLFGGACLHLGPVQLRALANWIEKLGGWITRCDLSLDVWSGLEVERVRDSWFRGEFDVRGKRPSQREHGSWSSGHSRTFEVGSRGTGKLMRAYEKGDELFGHEADDPWVRLEVEFRSNHRIIEPEILRRPSDFFAGAYPFCADYLRELDLFVDRAVIPTHPEIADKTAEAAVTRLVRWVNDTAAPALAAVWAMGGDMVADVIEKNQHRKARRLLGFKHEDIQAAFQKVASAFAPPFAH
jgi:phage replication initiation protein